MKEWMNEWIEIDDNKWKTHIKNHLKMKQKQILLCEWHTTWKKQQSTHFVGIIKYNNFEKKRTTTKK